jgi:hypothetical protein
VQVVTDPENPGNEVSDLGWDGRMSGSKLVRGDDDGFLTAFSVANANREAVSRVGIVDEDGHPTDRFAFLVANVGNPETPGEGGQSVALEVTLYDGDGAALPSTDQIDFPYRVVDSRGDTVARGTDLLEDDIDLRVPHVVEVAIEIDSRRGTGDIERARTLRFSTREAEGR